MKHSNPFKSADGLSTYVTMASGQRRRVEIVGGEIFLMQRPGKAAKKEAKRLKVRDRARQPWERIT